MIEGKEEKYFDNIPVPLRLSFRTPSVSADEYMTKYRMSEECKDYPLLRAAGKTGTLILGNTAIGRGTVTPDGDILPEVKNPEIIDEAQVRVSFCLGYAVLDPSSFPLRPGDLIVLDSGAGEPGSAGFFLLSEGWASGAYVVVHDNLGLRIDSLTPCRRKSIRNGNGIIVEVGLGGMDIDLSVLKRLGEGSLLIGDCSELGPFYLTSGGKPLAEGYFRPASVSESTVNQDWGDASGPSGLMNAFVVTRPFGPVPRQKPVPAPSSVEEEGPSLSRVLNSYPEDRLLNLLRQTDSASAGWLLQELAGINTPAAARAVRGLISSGEFLKVDDFIRCRSVNTSGEVKRAMKRYLMDTLGGEEIKNLVSETEETPVKSSVREDSVERAAAVFMEMDEDISLPYLSGLRDRDNLLAESVRKRTFFFEDLAGLDDRSIQSLLREIDSGDLARALYDSSQEVREAVFRNMTGRAAALLEEEMQYFGGKNPDLIIKNRGKIISVLAKLIENGEIPL